MPLIDLPTELVSLIFSWIHPTQVVAFRLLSRALNKCLVSTAFSLDNIKRHNTNTCLKTEICDSDQLCPLDRLFWASHKGYQEAYALLYAKHMERVLIWLTNLPQHATIPSQIGSFENLSELTIKHAGCTGQIPREIGLLTQLTLIDFIQNQFHGDIPAELGDLRLLKYLYLSRNCLTGSIPVALGKLVNLKVLKLDENQLTGTIPAELSQLVELQKFVLQSNQVTGGIPSELGFLTKLTHLSVVENRLSGSIPHTLTNLRELKNLFLSGNSDMIPADSVIRDWVETQSVVFAGPESSSDMFWRRS